MVNPNKRNSKRQVSKSGSHRVWKVQSLSESQALSEFLGICTWKLTSSEMFELKQEDIQKVFAAIQEGKITIEKIKSLDANELYDLIVGQLRLF